jgi:hypothetical protein
MQYRPRFKKGASPAYVAELCNQAIKASTTQQFMMNLALVAKPSQIAAVTQYSDKLPYHDCMTGLLLILSRRVSESVVTEFAKLCPYTNFVETGKQVIKQLEAKHIHMPLEPSTVVDHMLAVDIDSHRNYVIPQFAPPIDPFGLFSPLNPLSPLIIAPFSPSKQMLSAVTTNDIELLKRILVNTAPTSELLNAACEFKRYEMLPIIMAANSPTLLVPGLCTGVIFAHWARCLNTAQFKDFCSRY